MRVEALDVRGQLPFLRDRTPCQQRRRFVYEEIERLIRASSGRLFEASDQLCSEARRWRLLPRCRPVAVSDFATDQVVRGGRSPGPVTRGGTRARRGLELETKKAASGIPGGLPNVREERRGDLPRSEVSRGAAASLIRESLIGAKRGRVADFQGILRISCAHRCWPSGSFEGGREPRAERRRRGSRGKSLGVHAV